jgi:hypothetical protein
MYICVLVSMIMLARFSWQRSIATASRKASRLQVCCHGHVTSRCASFLHAMSRRFRIVASGTLFITHTLNVNSLPDHSQNTDSTTRASSVRRERGGASATVLAILAQFNHVEAYLVAPLGGGPEGEAILKELEAANVRTRLCARRDASGVPVAYIMCASKP